MNIDEAYQKQWSPKLEGIQRPEKQSIDRVKWIAELFPEGAQAGPLLDIGTGSGAMLYAGRRLGWQVIGTELEPRLVAYLKSVDYDVYRVDVNCEPLPVKDGWAGVVCLSDVIEHVFDPGYCLSEAYRTLRSGGRIFVGTPNSAAWRRLVSLARGTMFKTSGDRHLRDGGHVAYYAPVDLKSTLVEAGFRDVTIHMRRLDPIPGEFLTPLRALGADAETMQFTYLIAEAVKP